jgi:hypothetical protein
MFGSAKRAEAKRNAQIQASCAAVEALMYSMQDRDYVLDYVRQYPSVASKVVACVDSGMTWGDIAAVLRVASALR